MVRREDFPTDGKPVKDEEIAKVKHKDESNLGRVICSALTCRVFSRTHKCSASPGRL
jgi:hypothetical protein